VTADSNHPVFADRHARIRADIANTLATIDDVLDDVAGMVPTCNNHQLDRLHSLLADVPGDLRAALATADPANWSRVKAQVEPLIVGWCRGHQGHEFSIVDLCQMLAETGVPTDPEHAAALVAEMADDGDIDAVATSPSLTRWAVPAPTAAP